MLAKALTFELSGGFGAQRKSRPLEARLGRSELERFVMRHLPGQLRCANEAPE